MEASFGFCLAVAFQLAVEGLLLLQAVCKCLCLWIIK